MRAEGGRGASLGGRALLVALLIAAALGSFVIARSQRSQPDIVNSVELGTAALPDGEAPVAFQLTRADDRVDVLVIENQGTEQVRALRRGAPLEAGRQRFSWDLRRDDGKLVEPGSYAIRVILGEQGRDIRPPGRIEVRGAAGDSAEGADG